ncbi:glutamate receptor 2.8-like isoform X2 [Glycine soja]|uniref:glutamate receptor 2.8-like isoform X2 n=1 Tax=Glycine soja TaxID=3848 RepID=UPI00103DC284|nr:glutamate receptor 2.8-like isoform X2 [Glycine soja]
MTMSMLNLQKYFPSLPFYLILCLWPLHLMAREVTIPIGVVLDLNSPIGSMANSCIWMAHHDFYKQHPRFQTRLDLRTRNSGGDTVKAAYAAFDLITKEKVKAIIGPQKSEQARHVINLGRELGIPIISFSATSPSLSPAHTPIFIRMAQNDSSQVKAIAAIVEAYGWREVVLIYENTEYGNGLVPHLIDALDAVDTKVPYRSVIDPIFEESHILEELENLKENSTRIFIVHMTGEHGSRFFSAVEKAGMMSEGYGWIVTEGLSVELDPSALERMDNMQGVLGVRTIVRNNEKLDDFKKRWKTLSFMENNIKYHAYRTHTITLFGLWAYDTVWALAMAVENATNYGKQSASLVNAILATKFQGLSGYVDLKGGQLESSVVEVFNVIGHKERIIGYWSPKRGLFQDDQEKQKVRQPVWPGYTMDQPPKLRFGVPVRKGFTEFVKVETIFNTTKVSGFVVDVFLEVLKALPFSVSYEFVPLENYGALAGPIANNKSMFDAGVGDITIVYDRTNYLNFTLPYLESVVSMVVSMKHDEKRNMWVFLKPLSWGLWLTTGAALVLIGFVVWFLEHRSNNTAFRGTPKQQLGIVFWFSFSTLVFAHRERLVSNWSRGLLIIWIFVVLIITQSYTASLTSMLTIESLQPEFIDIKEIKRNNYFVGYQNQSFVKTILINELGFNESQLKAYNTPEEYHEALSKGTNNGGVAAIFDESPYINVFLSKYDTGYATVGPFYKTNGLAFAFPPQSPLVPYFSRALLNVIEDKDKFEGIKNKYFSTRIVSKDQSTSILDSQGLTVNSFAGLFIITTIASFVSFTFYVFTFLYSQ